jgi:hypothetical protein
MRGVAVAGGTVVLGLISGLAGAALFSRVSSSSAAGAKQAEPLTRPAIPSPPREENCENPPAPALGFSPAEAGSPRAQAAAAAPGTTLDLQDTVEGQIAIERTEHEKRMVSHRQEPKDMEWAPNMERTIAAAVSARSNRFTGTFSNVECRAVSCTLRLDWKDMETAMHQAPDIIADMGTDVPCVRQLMMDDDRDGHLRPSGTLYMDCGMVRYPDAQADAPIGTPMEVNNGR